MKGNVLYVHCTCIVTAAGKQFDHNIMSHPLLQDWLKISGLTK